MSPLRRLAVMACAGVMALAAISPAIAWQPGTYRDEFTAADYDGSDGSLEWGGEWHEAPLANGPQSGSIQVVGSGCDDSYCLRIGPGNVAGQGVFRDVDLAGAGSVTLSLLSKRSVPEGSSTVRAYVAVSEDGWQWTSVADIVLDKSDPEFVSRSIDLSPWAGTNIKLGFFGTGMFAGQLYVDDIDVALSANTAPVFSAPLPDRHDQEGDSVSFRPEATDPDGGLVTFSVSGLPSGLVLNPETGQITGTIADHAASRSPYTTVVTARDSAGAVASTEFRWSVADLNRPPTLRPIANQVVDEMTAMAVSVSADDPDLPDDTLEFSLVEAPSGATISPSGVVRWTPNEAAGPGSAAFTVRVEDAGTPAASAERSFTVAVKEVNQAPVLNRIPDMPLRPGDNVDYTIGFSDSDRPRNSLTVEATGLPPGVTMDAVTGLLSGRVPIDTDPASGTAVVTVRDDAAPPASSVQTFSWQIGTGNRAPVLDPIADPELNSDGVVHFVATASDADVGDTTMFWLAAGIDPIPAGASIDGDTGEFTWQPEEAEYARTYRINVGVSDSGSPRLSATQLVTIALPRYNNPPSLDSVPDQENAEGETVTLQLDGSDPDVTDTMHFAAQGLPPGLTIEPETGLISGEVGFEAAADSPFAVTVSVTDDGLPLQTATESFQWTVADTNRPPEVTPLSVVVLVDVPRSISLPVVDPDGDVLSYSISDQPILGTLGGLAPELTYTGTASGRDGFRFVAGDGEFDVEGLVTVEIRLSNAAPIAVLDEYAMDVDEDLDVAAPGVLGNDIDADGDSLNAVLIAPPDHGELTLAADGSFSYRPDAGYRGVDKFTYGAVDALDDQATATVVLAVGVDANEVAAATNELSSSRSAILSATNPSWVPPRRDDASIVTSAGHGAATVVTGLLAMLVRIRFAVMLLAAALALALAFGRVSLFGSGKVEGEGRVDAYDPNRGLGRLITDEDGSEVFVGAAALGEALNVGQRVEFVAATIRGKRVALRVWPST